MMPTKEGSYIARPINWGIPQVAAGKSPAFQCRFELLHWFDGKQWLECEQGLEMNGYFYLLKNMKDGGEPNTRTLESLEESLGWDGNSFDTLAHGEWSDTEVQLSTRFETFEKKTTLKIAFINPRDRKPGGGSVESDPSAIKSLDQQFGAKLRALKKQAGKPVTPTSTQPAKPDPLKDAKGGAWRAFSVRRTDLEGAERAEVFKDRAKHFSKGADLTTLKPVDWAAFQHEVERGMHDAKPVENPISEEEHFKEDDIPF